MSPLAKTTKFGYTRLRLLSRPVIALPLIVFVVFVAASLLASSLSQSSLDATRQHAIDRRAQENSLKLSSSLSSYQLIASGGAGLVNAGGISQPNWDSFVGAFNITADFPAINAVTYAEVMSQDQAQSFIDNQNATYGTSQALSTTKSDGDPYLLVKYAYPDTQVFISRLGVDEYTYPSRKAAIEQAIALNKPVLTSMPEYIKPNDDPNGAAQPGFILFAPIFDQSKPLDTPEERKAALIGTSNVSFRASKFFDSIYSDSDVQTKTYLTVYQGTGPTAHMVYSGGVHPKSGDVINHTQTIAYEGQTFTYVYEFSDSDLLTIGERDRPIVTLLFGSFLGGLLAILLLFSIRARLHRISSDKEREIQSAKDELLSLASHQLRTPATGVKQYMGMVLQGFAGDISPQQKEFLQKAYESNDRQLHIINDILHLAKLDAGRIVLSKTTFDMSELTRSVIDEQTDSAHDGEVELTSRMPKRMEVYADSHMMRMVIENLISNAIKYTNPGGKVTVSIKSTGKNIEVAVRDTGVGIDENDLDKLFKQFSRVANERSHLVSGTGVGLYLVKNLIELHGGNVTVSSRGGKGTVFTLLFPR